MRKERLRAMMDRRGLNVPSLAEMTGISERQIYHVLSGKGGMSDDSLFRVAQALECSSDYLLELTDDPTPRIRIDNLSEKELSILTALRRGDKIAAVDIIVSPEKV